MLMTKKNFEMKNYAKIFVALFVILGMASCSEDFLEREPSGQITAEQIQEASKTNPDISKAMVSGIYSLTFAFGTGGDGGHDDFGQKSIDICMDMMSGDMALGGKRYGWFSDVAQLQAMRSPDARALMNWTYYYTIIKSANEVIDGLGGTDAEPTDDLNRAFMGQAKTLRAYAYFYLANLYAHPNMSDPCVPIYDTQLTTEARPRSTVQEVLDFVISDLEDAVGYLDGYDRGSSKTEINQYVAEGYLAYAYLHAGRYSEAAAAAINVINNGGFPLMTATEITETGFNNVSIPGWMWAIDLTIDNSPALPTFWGMVDIFTYSYAGVGDHKGMDDGLWATIPDTDIRKQQFVDAFGDGGLLPIWKFYDNGRTVFGNRTWDNDEVYMRVAEMYLIAAEAYARASNETDAKEVLIALVADRDAAAPDRINGLSGQALLDEIYFQWRVEMWGEGKSLLAMKRFNATMTRGTNHVDLAGETYSYNDSRMIYEIPENELNNNPMISLSTPSASLPVEKDIDFITK